MNKFDLECRKFERLPQRHQISTTVHFTIEEVFETLESVDIYMSKYHSMIDPVVNKNFENILITRMDQINVKTFIKI